jgi:2,5-diketo-D-gluconate reductase B
MTGMLETQGISLPRLGLGTFRMQGAACQEAVESALALGYRHIDTAEMYGNEEAVGAAIAASGVARSELHITTKVWHDHLAPDAIARALDASLDRLGLDHIDLYLVHWPAKDMDLPAVLSALMRSREAGKTRAIGAANFTLAMLRRAVDEIGAPIACNQIEYHVFLDQAPMLGYLRSKAIPLVAYCPLAQGRAAESAELAQIAAKHGASAAQVALKWLLDQEGVAAIPKAGRRASQRANLDARSLTLDEEDRRVIASLPKRQRLVNPPFAPLWDVPMPE